MKLFITKEEILKILESCEDVSVKIGEFSVRAMEFAVKLSEFVNEAK